MESALNALAAIFLLIARILTIFGKKYRILTRRDKRESYLIVLQQNNVFCNKPSKWITVTPTLALSGSLWPLLSPSGLH